MKPILALWIMFVIVVGVVVPVVGQAASWASNFFIVQSLPPAEFQAPAVALYPMEWVYSEGQRPEGPRTIELRYAADAVLVFAVLGGDWYTQTHTGDLRPASFEEAFWAKQQIEGDIIIQHELAAARKEK